MIATELKNYIFKQQKIEYILEQIECHHIQYHAGKDFWSCGNPDGDNRAAINISNNKYLSYINWTRNVSSDDKQDIFNLIMSVKSISFGQALKWTHELLGLKMTPYKCQKVPEKPAFDPLDVFKKAKSMRGRHGVCNVNDIKYLPENTFHDFAPMIHIDLFREGINHKTVKKFGLCYSYRTKRVCYLHRYWMTGELLGINARTMIPNYDEFGISKYYLTPGMRKDANLYGLWENAQAIEEAGYVVVVESEKSVCKRDSLMDSTIVALSGKSMSEEQSRILSGLNINEVVLCLDKDVPLQEVYHMCEKLYHVKKVSFMRDNWNLLGPKDSPCDAPNKIYNFMFKYRQTYDEACHQAYLAELKRK